MDYIFHLVFSSVRWLSIHSCSSISYFSSKWSTSQAKEIEAFCSPLGGLIYASIPSHINVLNRSLSCSLPKITSMAPLARSQISWLSKEKCSAMSENSFESALPNTPTSSVCFEQSIPGTKINRRGKRIRIKANLHLTQSDNPYLSTNQNDDPQTFR